MIALVLLGVGGFVLNDLLRTESSGAFVKTTTLPIALVVTLMLLAAILLVQSILRTEPGADGAATGSAADASGAAPIDPRALIRVAGILVWIIAYIAALPWFGYLASSIVFLAGANLIYGNRNLISVIAISVIVPVALLLFFERFMIVLLPSARLFG